MNITLKQLNYINYIAIYKAMLYTERLFDGILLLTKVSIALVAKQFK